jgi:hypothetical protein
MANIIWILFVLLLTTIKINYETNKKYFLFFWEIVVEQVSVIAQFFINRVAKYDYFSTSNWEAEQPPRCPDLHLVVRRELSKQVLLNRDQLTLVW